MMNFVRHYIKKRPDLIKYIFISLVITVCGVAYCFSRYGASDSSAGEYGTILDGVLVDGQTAGDGEAKEQKEGQLQSGQSDENGFGSEGSMHEENAAKCYVYVCGYVNNPDVYRCREGARIYEVIELAGGFSSEADSEYLNLVAVVADGQRIYVPSKEEVLKAQNEGGIGSAFDGDGGSLDTGSGYGTGGKVNINTAGAELLMTLPGIGESRAKDIISYRNTNGSFERIEDIMKVSGIKNASYEKIKDLIKV